MKFVSDLPNEKITRFELIDEFGYKYIRQGVDVTVILQDDGRTLKVFVDPNHEN